jgi:fucose 4-O-acetylase-like acetyltransferase
VVCGHSWAGLIGESHSVRAFYMTVYDFHMPAFILLCGYFSQSFSAKPGQLRRVITGIVVPYVIFSIFYGALRGWVDGEINWNVLVPYYLLWFLAALFVWRMTAPVWRVLRHPVLVATAISIGAMMMDLPGVLDLGRVLQFLPFFVAGMFLERRHFEMLKRPLIRYGGLLLSAGIVSTFFALGGDLDRNWVYFNEGAAQMHLSPTVALPMKLVLMATSVTLLITFFAWVPDRKLPITKLGEYTMYAYLLHGFFVKSAEDGLGWYEYPFMHTALGAVTVTVAAVSLALLLMTKPVRLLTRPFVEPKLTWLFKREPDDTPPPSQAPAESQAPPEHTDTTSSTNEPAHGPADGSGDTPVAGQTSAAPNRASTDRPSPSPTRVPQHH